MVIVGQATGSWMKLWRYCNKGMGAVQSQYKAGIQQLRAEIDGAMKLLYFAIG
jgi:uncharacterized protein